MLSVVVNLTATINVMRIMFVLFMTVGTDNQPYQRKRINMYIDYNTISTLVLPPSKP